MLWGAIDGGRGVLVGGGVQEGDGVAGRDTAPLGAMWLCTLGEVPGTGPWIAGDSGVPRDTMIQRYLEGWQ